MQSPVHSADEKRAVHLAWEKNETHPRYFGYMGDLEKALPSVYSPRYSHRYYYLDIAS